MFNTTLLSTPYLRRSAKINQAGQDQIVIEYLEDEITLQGSGALLFGKIQKFLDGTHALKDISNSVGETPTQIKALTDQLMLAGVISQSSLTPAMSGTMTGVEFYALHHKYAAHWLQPVYNHPLWEKMITGKASRAQVIGFAFEKYHYIEGAHEHMAVAAANATPEMMPHLARHFIEEYSHGDIYRKGLRSLFADELILRSQPLPSTRALVNFLSETAARNSFSYYAGNEVLQMTENTGSDKASSAIDEFYAALRLYYPYTGKLIDSFIAHTRADQKLGHENVFMEICESIPPLTPKEVKDAMNVVKSMAEHLLLFMDGIEVVYEEKSAVPRMPCELLSE